MPSNVPHLHSLSLLLYSLLLLASLPPPSPPHPQPPHPPLPPQIPPHRRQPPNHHQHRVIPKRVIKHSRTPTQKHQRPRQRVRNGFTRQLHRRQGYDAHRCAIDTREQRVDGGGEGVADVGDANAEGVGGEGARETGGGEVSSLLG